MSPTASSLLLGLVLCSVATWAAIPEGVPDKPGTCPPEVVLPECAWSRFAPECLNDSACDRELKCCHSYCTLRCVQPLKGVPDKPGTCPPEVVLPECAWSKFAPQCANDSTCGGELKCCHSRCTLRCVQPIKEKSGICPRTLAKCAYPPPPPMCKNDIECTGEKKCCTPFCRQECTDPIENFPF
ncbi:antileukoproteinase-like isoform X2 [Ascaphus truei]|uniref:antileukoproteinase-like isoform X2 n=2 Tax=Ascaphus truei TaxID=8439 RepID=UPI003F59B847